MRKPITLVSRSCLLIAALALAVAGCSRDEKPAESPPSSPPPSTGAAKKPEGEDPPKAPVREEVKAATADDLARFVEDLEGDGKLMATIETSEGTFHCELFEKQTPLTVANFVGLARGLLPWRNPRTREVEKRPFYDGLIFHRVIPEFMIQGGCPLGSGSGDPGFRFANETPEDLKHDRGGLLSTANAGPNTNGSQFFVTEVATPHLDGRHNVFGACQEVDLVKKIARVESRQSRPVDAVVIQSVKIHRGP
jgi:peptidyl-prolyl cis-trans isomerase A (cyclophilin A)